MTRKIHHINDFFCVFEFYLFIFIYLLAVLGPCCCAGFSVVAASRATVLLQSTGSTACRLQLLHSMWDLSGPGIELVSPALAGRFFTNESPGKPLHLFVYFWLHWVFAAAQRLSLVAANGAAL